MRYCNECKRNVNTTKKFSWGFFLLFCLTGIGGIFYVLYYLFLKKKECPICGNVSNFSEYTGGKVKTDEEKYIEVFYRQFSYIIIGMIFLFIGLKIHWYFLISSLFFIIIALYNLLLGASCNSAYFILKGNNELKKMNIIEAKSSYMRSLRYKDNVIAKQKLEEIEG